MKSYKQWRLKENEQLVQNQAPLRNPDDIAASAPEGVPSEEEETFAPKEKTPSVLNGRQGKLRIKPWKASKTEILSFWRGLTPDLPLQLKPVDYEHEGSTIQEDGIRITGSKEFITTVLSRLKDFLAFENPESKLMIAYRQSPKSFVPGNKNSYIFYLQAKKRGKN